MGLVLSNLIEDEDDQSQEPEFPVNPLQNDKLVAVSAAKSMIFIFVKHIHTAANDNALFLPDYECDAYDHWEVHAPTI